MRNSTGFHPAGCEMNATSSKRRNRVLACASTNHRAAMPGPLIARAAVIKVGGTLATAAARIFDERDELVASGRALFYTRAPSEKKKSRA